MLFADQKRQNGDPMSDTKSLTRFHFPALTFAVFSVHFASQDGAMFLYEISNTSPVFKTCSENIK